MSTFSKIVATSTLALATAGLGSTTGCNTDEIVVHDDEHVGAADQALTAAQCDYFDVNGTVQICHQLGNGKFSILKLSDQACINAHGDHATDYVTSTDPTSPLYDPTCNGQGCLPAGAPCDATLEPCEGLICQNGLVISGLPEIVSIAIAPENGQVDAATWASDNAVGPDSVNDGVIDLVVRGRAKAISLIRTAADGTCWQTTQWDTITGSTSLLPGMSCGYYQIGSNTYGMAVSNDGGATMLNGATGDLPQLGDGLHSLKLYVPYLNPGGYFTARVQFEGGLTLSSPVLQTPSPTCDAGQTFCDAGCIDLNWDNDNCGACNHRCTDEYPLAWGTGCYSGACYYY